MKIQRRCHHPNQPPHLYKCGGNLALKSGLYTNANKSNIPLILFSFTFHDWGTVPLTLPRDYKASGSSQKSASLSSVRAVKAMQLSQFLPARPGS